MDDFNFFSDVRVEQIGYSLTGTLSGTGSNLLATHNIPLEYPVSSMEWRCYISVNGGNSWVSDSSPLYAANGFTATVSMSLAGVDTVNNRLTTTRNTTASCRFIIIGLIG